MYPNTYTNLSDRYAQRDSERDDRANSDDGARGGYTWRPNIFKPPRMLAFRVCRNYLYTYALLETVASKRASRINRSRIHAFMRWQQSVRERRALYSPRYVPEFTPAAPPMNIGGYESTFVLAETVQGRFDCGFGELA